MDLDAIEHNVSLIGQAVVPAKLCAVVKADGYGHGDVPVAQAALDAGADWLAVAIVEEGVRLREAGIGAPILVLSEPTSAQASRIVEWTLTPTVYRWGFAEALVRAVAASGESAQYPVHVKVDTGMHRVGADPQDAGRLVRQIAEEPLIEFQGLWTHLAVADEDDEFTKRQLSALVSLVEALRSEGIDPPIVHAANTAGALGFPDGRLDMVRVGLGIYGLRPTPAIGIDLDLRPAMRVVSSVSMTRELGAGERVSYGRRRPLPKASMVATIPIGYADGVARRLSEVGEVLIRGSRYPFAGTVTMDQSLVDLGGHPVDVGDEVVLLGMQGDEEITAEDWATLLDTINYEIVCDFGPRLPRRYIRAGDGADNGAGEGASDVG